MTSDNLKSFFEKQSSLKIEESKIRKRLEEISDEGVKNNLSCDHRFEDGKIAGPAFSGSYCGFICNICGCGVSYERMGY